MDIVIKRMETDEEIRGKGYVHWKSCQETYPGLMGQVYLDNLTLEKCIDMAFRWPENIWVAKYGDRVVGFAAGNVSRDPAFPDAGEVHALYLLREYHGQRVGLALMNTVMESFSQYHTVILWVLKGNERAIRFYERYGFRFNGTEKEMNLGGPCTALQMVLTR